jgi:hypothetical protein
MKYSTTTGKQQAAIVDFVATARGNGIGNIWACLPRNHRLITGNVVHQTRRVTDAIAEGWDELGNRVRLTADLRVLQD